MVAVQSGTISAGSPIWLQASALVAWRLYTVTGWFAACSTAFSNIVYYNCGPCPLAVGSPFLVLCSPIHGCVKGRGEPCSDAIERQNRRDNSITGSVSAGNETIIPIIMPCPWQVSYHMQDLPGVRIVVKRPSHARPVESMPFVFANDRRGLGNAISASPGSP